VLARWQSDSHAVSGPVFAVSSVAFEVGRDGGWASHRSRATGLSQVARADAIFRNIAGPTGGHQLGGGGHQLSPRKLAAASFAMWITVWAFRCSGARLRLWKQWKTAWAMNSISHSATMLLAW